MQTNENPRSKSSKGSFRDTFNQLTFFTVVASIIVFLTPLAPSLRPFIPSALGYTLLTWGLICGLPLAWDRRKKWWPLLVLFLTKGARGMKQVGHVIPTMPSLEGMKTAIQPVLPGQSEALTPAGVPDALPAPFNMLPINPHPKHQSVFTKEEASQRIGSALQLSGISFEGEIEILAIDAGPTLQTIHFALPSRVQMSSIKNKMNDISTHIVMGNSLDIVASRFQSAVAFVMRKEQRNFVYMRDLVTEFLAYSQKAQLPVMLGVDMEGKPLFSDLTKFPHLLMAGTTGSGKSVELNTIVQSILLNKTPDECKVVMIDPKKVEFSDYQGYPHLMMPVVTNPRHALVVLRRIISEMDRRYDLFSSMSVKNIVHYNSKSQEQLPYIVVVIDELADLVLVASAEIEDLIVRLAQLARAAGIHLIVGTQRPSVDVISGLVKANLPTRMAFKMTTGTDYRTVMERGGPKLQGQGDGVFVLSGGDDIRFQSAAISVSDAETADFIQKVRTYWRNRLQRQPENELFFDEDEEEMDFLTIQPNESIGSAIRSAAAPARVDLHKPPLREEASLAQSASDPLGFLAEVENEMLEQLPPTYESALLIGAKEGIITVDMLKLRLDISYEQAREFMKQMHDAGLLGEYLSERRAREFIGEQVQKLTEEELYEAVKRQVFESGKVSSEGLAKQFTVQKQKMIGVLKKLAEDGVLHRPETNGASYTIAWSEEEIQRYLQGEPVDDLPY